MEFDFAELPYHSPIDFFGFWCLSAPILLKTREEMQAPNRIENEDYYKTIEGSSHARHRVYQGNHSQLQFFEDKEDS